MSRERYEEALVPIIRGRGLMISLGIVRKAKDKETNCYFPSNLVTSSVLLIRVLIKPFSLGIYNLYHVYNNTR